MGGGGGWARDGDTDITDRLKDGGGWGVGYRRKTQTSRGWWLKQKG